MKKLTRLIMNVYRICFVNPTGGKQYVSYKEEIVGERKIISESMIRQIIVNDPIPVEAEQQIRDVLRQRVMNKGHSSEPVKNSFFDILIPLFSGQHVEIKMAVVSLILLVFVGLGQRNNQVSNRKLNLFFLADTLGDSSSFQNPAAKDTAFRIQYK